MTKEEVEKVKHNLAGLTGLLHGLIALSIPENNKDILELIDKHIDEICEILDNSLKAKNETNQHNIGCG